MFSWAQMIENHISISFVDMESEMNNTSIDDSHLVTKFFW